MRIYYGWFIVATGVLVLTLTVGATVSAFGLFVLPASAAFDLSRADINTGIVFLNLGMAVAAPIVGRILDFFPARRVMVMAALLFGASLAGLGLSHDAWLSAALLAVPLALAVVGLGTMTSVALVARWFTAYIGRAMAITAIGMSLGGVVVVPVIGVLLVDLGWRQALIATGGVLAALFLLLALCVREKPGADDHETRIAQKAAGLQSTRDAATGAEPIRIARLLRLPRFWQITVSATIMFGAMQAIIVTLVPLAQESGISVTESASLLSAWFTMAIAGKLLLAWRGDGIDRIVLLAALFAATAFTSAALLFGDSYATLIVVSALFGLAAGATMPTFLALITDQFGSASFGTVNGAALFMSAITSSFCIRYSGELYDRTGHYDAIFLSYCAIALLSSLLMLSARSRHAAQAQADSSLGARAASSGAISKPVEFDAG